jgi:hypothetical protein
VTRLLTGAVFDQRNAVRVPKKPMVIGTGLLPAIARAGNASKGIFTFKREGQS